MKKRLISTVLVVLLVLSSFSFAVSENQDSCAGFLGSLKCFLFGDATARAGQAWWDRSAVVGKAESGSEPAAQPEPVVPSGQESTIQTVTGTDLFGAGATCPDCLYARDNVGNYYIKENGKWSYSTDEQRKQLVTKESSFQAQDPETLLAQMVQEGSLVDIQAAYTELLVHKYPNNNQKLLAYLNGIQDEDLKKDLYQVATTTLLGPELFKKLVTDEGYDQFYNCESKLGEFICAYRSKEATKAMGIQPLQKGIVAVSEFTIDGNKKWDETKEHTFTYVINQERFAKTSSQTPDKITFFANGKETEYLLPDSKPDQEQGLLTYATANKGDVPLYLSEEDKKNNQPSALFQTNDKFSAFTNFEDETQTKWTSIGETYKLEGDYYEDKKCMGFGVGSSCFIPNSGTYYNPKGGIYLYDPDYSGTGAERTLERAELFSTSGVFEGVKLPNGDAIIAQKENGKYTDKFVDKNGQEITSPNNQQRAVIAEIKEFTTGWRGQAQTSLADIYALTKSIKSYTALSQLMGIDKWWQDTFKDVPILKDWVSKADQTFAPMLGSNWFPSAICEGWHKDIEPEGKAMIKTSTGTYQAVASIQLERSFVKYPILCQPNPDTEAAEKYLCGGQQVCVQDLCYPDADQDQEADSETPLQGYLYKITWGVSSPWDEAFTPFIDEDGNAVSFNIVLDKNPNGAADSDALPLYRKEADSLAPIKLKNGDRDQDVIIHYSSAEYQEACIRWKQAPSTVEMGGSGAAALGPLGASLTAGGKLVGASSSMSTETIGDVCFSLAELAPGEVGAAKPTAASSSVKVSSGEVSLNTQW